MSRFEIHASSSRSTIGPAANVRCIRVSPKRKVGVRTTLGAVVRPEHAVFEVEEREAIALDLHHATEHDAHNGSHSLIHHHNRGHAAVPLTNIESVFPSRHVQRLDPLFILYFPFGLCLAVFRMLLWVGLLLADQPWLTDNNTTIAVLQAVLGVRVEWRNTEFIPEERHVLVSNHVTTGDLMALYRRPQRIIHLVSTGLPTRVTQAEHHRVDLRHASVETYDQLANSVSETSIHLFPEGGMTNGTGMMKFSRGFMRFADGIPVAPVALRACLPWGISTHTLDSSFLSNMFWFCFCPYVSLQLTVLPPVQRMLGETKAKFVERVQQQIAEELRIPIYDYTVQSKKKLVNSLKAAGGELR